MIQEGMGMAQCPDVPGVSNNGSFRLCGLLWVSRWPNLQRYGAHSLRQSLTCMHSQFPDALWPPTQHQSHQWPLTSHKKRCKFVLDSDTLLQLNVKSDKWAGLTWQKLQKSFYGLFSIWKETNRWVTVTAMARHALAVSRNKLAPTLPSLPQTSQTGASIWSRFLPFYPPHCSQPNLRLTSRPVRKLMTQHLRTCVKDLLQVLRDLPKCEREIKVNLDEADI